ncbi:hypothetical protein [Serratia inhibens]|nr:hypothetical protein [Serratia inhibens]
MPEQILLLTGTCKLQEDFARKTRHQKPALQQQWRNEIAEITVRLKLD